MESVWQHGGSIRVKISKIIPWDIHVTPFGMMLLLAPFNTVLSLWRGIVSGYEMPWMIAFLVFFIISFIIINLAITFFKVRPLWSYYIGTQIHFTDPRRLETAHRVVQENGFRWNKDVADTTIIDSKKMSMTFRRKDHALLTKLAA